MSTFSKKNTNSPRSISKKIKTSLLKGLTLLALLAGNTFSQSLTMWFAPGADGAKCKAITDAISSNSGLTVTPRIAVNYSEIYRTFSAKQEGILYAGSFAGATLTTRGVITPLLQKIDGKELYCGVLIYPKAEDPAKILSSFPADISFAIGASSGESSAKAATAQKANIGVKDHMAAVNAVKAGKAKAAVVKNFWWDANKDKFPEFALYEIPGISVNKNPDNIIMISSSTNKAVQEKITQAVLKSQAAFGATKFSAVDASAFQFSIELMKKAGIDANAETGN